jgi:hypothetical protein
VGEEALAEAYARCYLDEWKYFLSAHYNSAAARGGTRWVSSAGLWNGHKPEDGQCRFHSLRETTQAAKASYRG